MKIRNLVMMVLMTVALMLTTGFTLAWPDQPPDRATISGPGIAGVVEITDRNMLDALRLGAFEDFETGSIKAPAVSGEGYHLTRYFYGGTFDFGTLLYYPAALNGRGVIRFDDGPQLQGDHTPFNGQWLYVTPAGESAMQQLFASLNLSPAPVAVEALPASVPASSIAVWLIGLIAAAIVAGGLLVSKRKHA